MELHDRLRDYLHATAVDDAAWPAFLTGLSDELGASEVVLGGAQSGRAPEVVAPRTDPGHVSVYNEAYHQQNALMRAVMQQGPGAVTLTDTLPESEAFKRSEFYNLWCVPQNFNHAAALNLSSATGWAGALVANTREQVTSAQLEQLRAIAPDVQRAVEQWRVLLQLRAANRMTLDTLDLAGIGALFLDRFGRVLDSNGLAQAMLADGRLLLRDGQICGQNDRADQALGQLMTRCLLKPDAGGGRVQIAGPGGPLTVQCAPFPGDLAYPVPQRPSLIVLITDPQHKLRQRMAELIRACGLTRAEAELALAVVRSGSRKTAAEMRGVSDATARSQLTSIFDKTGVRRQTELVRLLMDEG